MNKEVARCGYWSLAYGAVAAMASLIAIITIQRNPLPLSALHLGVGLLVFTVGANIGAEKYASARQDIDRTTARAIGRVIGLAPVVCVLGAFSVALFAKWLKGA